MKFGQRLLEHIEECEKRESPCVREDYVDYGFLKQQIKTKPDLTEVKFRQMYEVQRDKFTTALSRGESLSRDPQYTSINTVALDKISKKFDRRLDGRIRQANWEELRQTFDRLQLDDTMMPQEQDNQLPAPVRHGTSGKWVIFVAGAISGFVSRTLTAPLDRIKLVLQAGTGGGPLTGPAPRKGSVLREAAKCILKDGGVRGFWRGNGANVIKMMPESAIKFYVYDVLKGWQTTNFEGGTSIVQRLLAGSLAGGIAQAAVYPLDVTKTRLAVSSSGTYMGIFHCLQHTVAMEGPRALYKGVGVALLAIVPAAGIDLCVYNTLRERYQSRRKQNGNKDGVPIMVALSFGVMSSLSGAVVAYPLTLVRTRLIAQGDAPNSFVS